MSRVRYVLVNHLGKQYEGCNVSSILAPKDSTVVDLQHLIRQSNFEKLYGISPSSLRIYVNKQAFDENVPSPLSLSMPTKNLITYGNNEHLIVIVPKPHVLYVSKDLMKEIAMKALEHALICPQPSLTLENQDFSSNIIGYYGCDQNVDEGSLGVRCMLLDIPLPKQLVPAVHIFRKSNEFLSEDLLGFSDIDDERNGLLLFNPLKQAFDTFMISFIWNFETSKYHLKLWNQHFSSVHLIDFLFGDNHSIRDLLNSTRVSFPINGFESRFDLHTTFGDIDGKPLVFHNDKIPFARCLNFQARLARAIALRDGLIPADSPDFQDHWSEFDTKTAIESWLCGIGKSSS